MYNASFYNIPIERFSDENTICIYNSKSGAIVRLKQENWEALCNHPIKEDVVREYIPELLRQGIIIDYKKDEIQEIIFNMRKRQYSSTGMLSLVIAPTMQCNYKCTYCFENESKLSEYYVMGNKEISGIYDFISKYLQEHFDIKKLSIHWFGGEPLLAYEKVIKPLSSTLISLAQEKKIDYQSAIITNGFLLDYEVFKELTEKCLIDDYQITFDGRKDNYIRMKCPPINAYEKVKNNILSISNYIAESRRNIKVHIRINVDSSNVDDAKPFVEEIKGDSLYKNNLMFYLGRIRGTDYSLDVCEFERYEDTFNEYIKKKTKFLEPRSIWCNQFSFNSFCIGPTGEIYKCEHDFERKGCVIGNITTGLYYNDFLEEYMNQPVADCCKECKIFPICLGGCPNYKYHSKQKHSCEYSHNRIIKSVEKYIKEKTDSNQAV